MWTDRYVIWCKHVSWISTCCLSCAKVTNPVHGEGEPTTLTLSVHFPNNNEHQFFFQNLPYETLCTRLQAVQKLLNNAKKVEKCSSAAGPMAKRNLHLYLDFILKNNVSFFPPFLQTKQFYCILLSCLHLSPSVFGASVFTLT